jgi:hypothetical protein
MTTYKITASTNGYIASRDIHFNGRTSYTVIDGLTHEKALEKLNDFCLSDYSDENATIITTKEQLIKEGFWGTIQTQADACEMEFDSYFELTAKRWNLFYDKKTNRIFGGFKGAGVYRSNGEELVLEKTLTDNSYSYDSRGYSIEED